MTTPLVVDANSLIKRCIMASALDDLKAGGVFTGGVYGTLNSLRAFLDTPEGHFCGPIIALFDDGIPPRRLELLPDYKSARAERKKLLTDEEKVRAFEQMGIARKMLGFLGVLCLSYEDREADDAVGAVCRIFIECLIAPLVMTGDRDLWQMVGRGARVYDLNKKRFIDDDNFLEIAGVESSTYLLYKALVGDPSDSIVGCPGCGPKRAQAIIVEATEQIALFEQLNPWQQLAKLKEIVEKRKKPKKFEEALVERYEYLRKVLEAIDLWTSFGGLKALRKRLKENRPTVRKMDFLRLCKKLNFQSVLGAPDKYARPFTTAAMSS